MERAYCVDLMCFCSFRVCAAVRWRGLDGFARSHLRSACFSGAPSGSVTWGKIEANFNPGCEVMKIVVADSESA